MQIRLSESDIKSFVGTYKTGLKQGFLRDSDNDRRNAEAYWSDGSANIKIAVHGTSLTPLKSSYGALRNLLPWESTNLLAPSRGGWSFRLRLPNDSLYKRKRRINLITPFDDWTIGSTVLNRIARTNGLISPDDEFKSVQVNGYDVGIYLLQEAIDKVLLERDYKITHYAVINRAMIGIRLMRGIVLRISIHQKHMSFLGRQRKQKNKHLKPSEV